MTPTTEETSQEATPAAAPAAPVMDVVPPRTDPPAPVPTEPEPQLAQPPAEEPEQLAQPPAEESPDQLIEQEAAPHPEQQPEAVKTQKPPGNGVGAAIAGTVIIVLALSAMAVIAYMHGSK